MFFVFSVRDNCINCFLDILVFNTKFNVDYYFITHGRMEVLCVGI